MKLIVFPFCYPIGVIVLKRTLYFLQPSFLSSFNSQSWKGIAIKPALVVLLFCIVMLMIPMPQGLDPKAWNLFIIFAGTILGVVLRPLPLASWTLLSLCVCLLTNTLTTPQALGSFGNGVVWLVVFAFFISRGFIKTGLGARLAYTFVKIFGRSTLGLSYGLVLTDVLLAPTIPSNTARLGGILFPILSSLSEEYGSTPEKKTSRKIGAFLLMTIFQADMVACAMFLTAIASNPLAVSIAASFGIELTWMGWLKASCVPAILNILVIPALLYYVYPPELKKTPDAPKIALQKLTQMGKLSLPEIVMLGTFVLLVGLWIFGSSIGISASTTALLGIVILLVTGVLQLDDLLAEKGAWTTLIWFAILLTLAFNMAELGFMKWLGVHIQSFVEPFPMWTAVSVISIGFFFSHYFFASSTAHISSMYAMFLLALLGVGAPPLFSALILSFASSLSSCLTHYGTGAAPIYFGANYISVKEWCKLGFICGITALLIWGVVGITWWYMIGLLG